jgi:hypothetical protein
MDGFPRAFKFERHQSDPVKLDCALQLALRLPRLYDALQQLDASTFNAPLIVG